MKNDQEIADFIRKRVVTWHDRDRMSLGAPYCSTECAFISTDHGVELVREFFNDTPVCHLFQVYLDPAPATELLPSECGACRCGSCIDYLGESW